MLDADIIITKQYDDARYVQGEIMKDVRIEFYVGKFGPFSERIPKADFSVETRAAVLNTAAAKIRA